MRTLICGFEPFGERDINNAWEIAKRFEWMPETDVIKIQVSFEKSYSEIIKVLLKNHYDLIRQ